MDKICEYCRLEKPHMSEDKRYYDFGFKLKNYWICEDCEKDKDNKTQRILRAPTDEFRGYEGLLRIIKELSVQADGTIQGVNFYQSAREAYAKSNSFREYVSDYERRNVDVSKIDRDYTPLWEFTYRIVSGDEPRITTHFHHDGDFDVYWVPDAEKTMEFNETYVEGFERNEKKKEESS
jgi:hypothetical protein